MCAINIYGVWVHDLVGDCHRRLLIGIGYSGYAPQKNEKRFV